MEVKKDNKKKAKLNVQVSREQASLMLVIAAATAITAFCLASSKVMLSQAIYQGKVISARHKAVKQLNDDIANANTLVTQYNSVFIGTGPTNILNGQNTSDPNATPPNGDNGKLVLDALPTTYDFPAILSTMSGVLSRDGIGSPSIGGTDQANTITAAPTTNPQPANVDLTLSGSGSYSAASNLISDLEKSIRPFDITRIDLNGNESSMTLSLNLTTYYQPAKTINITEQKVK